MLAPDDVFNPSKFHCPGCNATLNTASNTCPHCGFNAHICMARFPFKPPPLTRMMDSDNAIDTRGKKRLSKTIARLEKRFPQITVSFCVALLPNGVDGRQFGYWLLNRCPPTSELQAKRRLHHLLMLVDRNNETVSTSVGYGLDCFLDDVTLSKALHEAKDSYIRGGYVEGSIKWINIIRKKLVSIHEEAAAAYDRRFHLRHRNTTKETCAISEKSRKETLPPIKAQLSPQQERPSKLIATGRS